MAIIQPFRALRPVSGLEEEIACVPYDVPYDSEVRETIAANPKSFLRITRPEAEFPEGSSPTTDEIIERSVENLNIFLDDHWMVQEERPSLYVYRLSREGHSQTGVVGICSIDEYDQGLIKKHEKTRPDKVKDRTDHMIGLRAQTGLIFLTYRATDQTRRAIEAETSREPDFECGCSEGVTQSVWTVQDPVTMIEAFGEVPSLYVADGHHRAESASLTRDTLRAQNPYHNGDEAYNFVMAGVFPSEDLEIMPYNRAVKDLNGLSAEEFLGKLKETCKVEETSQHSPAERGKLAMLLAGKWYEIDLSSLASKASGPIDRLDVSLLQQHILTPLLGIDDPRTNTRITFVGGARGTEELEKLVASAEAAVAFSMYPTSIDDLLSVSDMDEVMPPKSTWFEPKLKDGLFVHLI